IRPRTAARRCAARRRRTRGPGARGAPCGRTRSRRGLAVGAVPSYCFDGGIDDIIRPLMSHQPVIDGFELATAGATQEGTLPISSFPRLHDVLVSDSGEAAYTLRGVRDERGRPSLRLKVHATLSLRCQRCLGPLEHE